MNKFYGGNESSMPSKSFFDDEQIVRTRYNSEQIMNEDKRKKATRYVASAAKNRQDCAFLLAALGLEPEDGIDK